MCDIDRAIGFCTISSQLFPALSREDSDGMLNRPGVLPMNLDSSVTFWRDPSKLHSLCLSRHVDYITRIQAMRMDCSIRFDQASSC